MGICRPFVGWALGLHILHQCTFLPMWLTLPPHRWISYVNGKISNYLPDWLHIITFSNSEIFNLNRGINTYVLKRNIWMTNPYRCNQIKQKDLPHPGLSDSLHPTWPTSSEMLRARHSIFLLVSGSYISISLWMWYTCNSFAISSVTYRDSGIITWNIDMVANLSVPSKKCDT